jgi:hypothetical protein
VRLAALTLLLAASSAAADPFAVRDQNPLLAGFGVPSAMPARFAATGGWSLGADLHWGSTALAQQRGSEILLVDAETREARLTLQGALTERIALQLQLPYRYTGAGNLDGFIDTWHDVFGLSEGARSALPSDQLNVSYTRAGSSLLNMTSSRGGLADVQAALGYEMTASAATALTAWLSIKLPSGDADKLTGSGATDVALLLAGQHRLDSRWSVFGQAAVTWLGDGEFIPARQRSVVWSGLAGLSWQAWRGLSLKAQVDAHTAAFDSELDFLGQAIVLTVGGNYRFVSGWQLDLGVSEDIAVEHSPDVVFVMALKRDW